MTPRRKEKRTERSKLDATPPWETREREPVAVTTGPFDVADAPDDSIPRVDLGAMFVPVTDGLELRLEMNEAEQVIAVTIANPNGHMQMGVFAAPRTEGIWDEVRAEIAASLRSQKCSASEKLDGPFGTELVGTAPGDGGKVPVRFVGVNGPRWFLRAMFVGQVATEASKAAPMERILRNVVVDRGTLPLPVREPVPLTMPKDGVDAEGESGDAMPEDA